MLCNIWAKVEIDETERQRIKEAIKIMNEIDYVLDKTGIESCTWAINDLRDGVSVLNGILEGEKY